MEGSPIHTPPGSQDLLPDDVRLRRTVQAAWFRLAAERGYQEVIPPTFEYEEVFTRGAGPDLARRLLRFVDGDGRVVALRADFTSSIARLAAARLSSAPLPLRLCYAGKVYRQEPEGAGRRRELFQQGAELIGEAGARGDVEVLRLAIDTLRGLGLSGFRINVGDSRFVLPVLADLAPAAAAELRRAIDRRDRPALAAAPEGMQISLSGARLLAELPELIGRAEVLERAAALASTPAAAEAVERLKAMDALLTEAEREHVVYDLGEIRGLGYYTGMQFEIFVTGSGRAVGFGGRYDTLLALYGADRPAVGFALETDTLAGLVAGGGPR